LPSPRPGATTLPSGCMNRQSLRMQAAPFRHSGHGLTAAPPFVLSFICADPESVSADTSAAVADTPVLLLLPAAARSTMMAADVLLAGATRPSGCVKRHVRTLHATPSRHIGHAASEATTASPALLPSPGPKPAAPFPSFPSSIRPACAPPIPLVVVTSLSHFLPSTLDFWHRTPKSVPSNLQSPS